MKTRYNTISDGIQMDSTSLKTQLMDLGLNTEEVAVYSLLLSKGSLTARLISEETKIIVNSIYRATNNLEAEGLIKTLDTRPRQFQAVSPRLAIKQLATRQVNRINQTTESIIKQLDYQHTPNQLHMDILTGREELFDCFVEFAKKTKKELLVISVGEPVPESIWLVTQSSIARGVSPKFIFHKHNKDNILLIKRWLAMGVPVRHYPAEGYHLNIFDNAAAVLSASNPHQSKERTGVVIYNQAIIEALRTYFFHQWHQSKALKP